MSQDAITVALVGYGFAGKTIHAPLIAATPGLRLACVVSSDKAKVREDFPDMTVCADLSSALADPGLDLVVIATPNICHAPQAEAALTAGKHVVVDKPMTVTVPDARRLIAQAEQARRLLSVFHNRRWDGDFLTLQRLIADGSLGRISQFESHYDRFRPKVRDRWRERDGPGAGSWYDLGPHLIDQALQLFGPPGAIFADLGRQRAGAQAVDYFHVLLSYETTRVILHGGSLTPAGDLRFAIHGDGGSFIKFGMDPQELALRSGQKPGLEGWGRDAGPAMLTRVVGDVPSVAPLTLDDGDYRFFYQGVRDAINGRAANPVPGWQALAVMNVIALAIDSADRGQRINL